MAGVPEVIVGAAQIAEAAGKVIDFAGRVMPQKAAKAPTAPAGPVVYEVCELKTLTLYPDENRVDLNFACRRHNDDGSLASAQPVTVSMSKEGLTKVVSTGTDALSMLENTKPPPKPLT